MAEGDNITGSSNSEYSGDTAKDVIKGWNDRRKSNNQHISGLVPFVQLIGLFGADEYERLFTTNSLEKRRIVFTDVGGRDIPINTPYTTPIDETDVNLAQWIKEKLEDRFINVYMVDYIDTGLSVAPMDGIVMASTEGKTQVQDASGGVGITDLQVDYGKSNVFNTRKFVIRMTVADPTYLNTHPEYAKLAGMTGEFLIIYGWANPSSIPGYSAAVAPPLLEPDPIHTDRNMMVVPMRNLGNGGYWSAGRVDINTYDFSFNPMGQMEISITLRDKPTTGLITTRVSTIAPLFKKLMGTGDTTDDKNFINMVIKNSNGGAISIKDKVLEEQNRLAMDRDMSAEDREAAVVAAELSYGGQVEITSLGSENEPLSSVMEKWNVNEESYFDNAGAGSNIAAYEQKKLSESLGFPNSLGIATYERYKKTIKVPSALDDLTDEAGEVDEGPEDDDFQHVKVDDYKVKTVYYYLGWVMEGVRLSLSEANRGREIEGEPIFNPKFFYTDNSNDSQLTTAFQRTIPPASRGVTMEERIQRAILRLKEHCMPPAPRLRGLTDEMKTHRENHKVQAGIFLNSDSLRDEAERISPCGGKTLISGHSTELKESIVDVIFPLPPSVEEIKDVPHRGFIITIDVRDSMFEKVLDEAVTNNVLDDGWKSALQSEGPDGQEADDWGLEWYEIKLFKPDWYQEFAVDNSIALLVQRDELGAQIPVPAGGSPDGYDPNNPVAYMSRSRGGRFYYVVEYQLTSAGSWATGRPIDYRGQTILTVNDYRKGNEEIWQLTQRRWHNLFIRYLHVYFERLIRARILELELEGRTVEEIYDEPVDLDYLTGKIFRNQSMNKGWQLNNWSPQPDPELLDLVNENGKLPNRLIQLADRIRDIDLKLEELQNEGTSVVRDLNIIRGEIEDLTGGKYEREIPQTQFAKGRPAGPEGPLGHRVLSNYKNWDHIERGNKNRVTSGLKQDPETGEEVEVDVWLSYEAYVKGTPRILLDWILWEFYSFPSDERPTFGTRKIPTNNFYWASYADAESNRNAGKVGQQYSRNNLQTLWIEEHPEEYEQAIKMKEEKDAELKIQFGLESVVVVKLNNINLEYSEWVIAKGNIESTIEDVEIQLRQYAALLNDDNKMKVLSPYDDTSDIDVNIPIDMGRQYPMVLTSKVAYQYYRRLSSTSNVFKRGTLDIMNYGPPYGGLRYQRPSNTKEFKYFPSREGATVTSAPRMIADPVEMQRVYEHTSGYKRYGRGGNALSWLATGVPTGDRQKLNSVDNGTYDANFGSGVAGAWIHWGAFGIPGTPNEDGRNEYGFKTGPSHEMDTYGSVGGTNVVNYGEFLDLFGLKVDPEIPGFSRIVGPWPKPEESDNLKNDNGERLLFYNMIDEYNNIIRPDGQGWFITTGWVLSAGGLPVFLYPDVEHAVRIDEHGEVIRTGYSHDPLHLQQIPYGDRNAMKPNYQAEHEKGGLGQHREEGKRWSDWGPVWESYEGPNDLKNLVYQESQKEEIEEKEKEEQNILDVFKSAYGAGLALGGSVGSFVGLFGKKRHRNTKKPETNYTNNAGRPYNPVGVAVWGPRIGEGEHNQNLTIHEKRALVIRRGVIEQEHYTLGRDMPAPWGSLGSIQNPPVRAGNHTPIGPSLDTDRLEISWREIRKRDDNLYVWRNTGNDENGDPHTAGQVIPYKNEETIPRVEEYTIVKDGFTEIITEAQPARTVRSGGPIFPLISRWRPYTNKDYPYGTGFYQEPNYGNMIHGSWRMPQKKPSRNYTYIGDLLSGFPGQGFFTNVNNDDYSPTKILPDGSIVDGDELNEGFVQFIVQNVMAPLPRNRRIACRGTGLDAPVVINTGWRTDTETKNRYRTRDVCYGDLFASMPDDTTSNKKDISLADLTNLKMDNVADIPIRRDVVDNLMNKNNNSMSLASFFAEIFKPSSVGVQSANINIAAQQKSDGTFDIYQANKNWQIVARRMMDEYDELTQNLPDRYPQNFMLFDYKSTDSLIQNIDMSSKFDPMMGIAFEHGAEAWTGDQDKIAKYLAYGNVAKDLQIFLTEQNPDWEDIIDVDTEGTEEVKVNLKRLLGDSEGKQREVPQSVFSKFLQADPSRLLKLNALIQASPGSNFATQLLAEYMRKTTITIHGTTNIYPSQTILVRGVVPSLEGLYLVTNTKESITPQDFQTIVDAVLIKPVSVVTTLEQAEQERRNTS